MPSISVITPSFNQAEFLPDTLRSVREQSHAALEHLVYDPGSTDGSREIAAAAEGVTLIAEPDNGQADAVARGMTEAKGDIIAWINSDDEYFNKDVFKIVSEAFDGDDAPDIVFGDGIYVDDKGAYLRDAYIIKNPDELGWRLAKEVGILQPATFISKKLIERIGAVDPDLHFCMDYEFWVRAMQSGAKFKRLDEVLAKARYYENNKTLGLRRQSLLEVVRMVKSKFGFAHRQWLAALADFERNGHDGILKTFDNQQNDRVQFNQLIEEFAWRANGDYPTVRSLEKRAPAKIVGDTFDKVQASAARQQFVLPNPVAEGQKDPPRTKGYTVGTQRWAFDREWLESEFGRSDTIIEQLKAARKSDVCVIAGNGPSLNETDFDALEDVDVFITNYAFMNKKLAAVANFLCVTNYLVAEQEAESFNLQTDFIKFAPYWLAYCLLPTAESCYIRSIGYPEFGTDYRQNISWRSTVSFFAMQIAYALGYKKVLLIGFDHSYTQPKSQEGDLIDQKTDDPNHFDPRYFKGKKWQAADTDNMEAMYRLSKEAFEADNREIINCTVGGKLEIFRRGDLATEVSASKTDRFSRAELKQIIVGDPAEIDRPKANSEGDSLSAKRDTLVSQLPNFLKQDIFLPTKKISLGNQVEGLGKINKLYNGGLEKHRERLRDLKASRTSDRCFIIGNGPSLKNMDLSLLKDEDTFAVNGFFLKYGEIGWRPTYYVVEDHLVAEDRASQINQLTGSTKLVPAYLAYCLNGTGNTIFFDHRPRDSFPRGFDFSLDASIHTYTGCTVTYTCMQLAFFLGYKEIYLVGVDADYEIPKDVKRNDSYGTDILDMPTDDRNHFHPDYFGKGYRWHDPQVEKMISAYKVAKTATEENGVQIFNATLGGKLEVFERRPFDQLMAHLKTSPTRKQRSVKQLPRLLLLDITAIGDGSATGEIKANLLGQWPDAKYLQIFSKGKEALGVRLNGRNAQLNLDELDSILNDFDPEVILYRPVPDSPALHNLAMEIIAHRKQLPVVTWIMDDWPTATMLREDGGNIIPLVEDFKWLLKRSSERLSISEQMSAAFEASYGQSFVPIANGVKPEQWSNLKAQDSATGPLVVRYAGSLAENMSLSSILKIAQAVEELADSGTPIKFEIKTRKFWYNLVQRQFLNLKQTTFVTGNLPSSEYRQWLAGGDVSVIGYNFDDTSRGYTRHSMANKLPECLASGSPLLAVGPSDFATVHLIKKLGVGTLVEENSVEAIAQALQSLASSPESREKLARKGQEVAFTKFNLYSIRPELEDIIIKASKASQDGKNAGLPRSSGARIDETEVVAYLLKDRRGRGHTMLDVGAHVGSSTQSFFDLDWTVHCFEPDPLNRAMLIKRFGLSKNVTIDPRGVSDKPAKDVPFYTSDESTGISGLSAFRDSHRQSAKVDLTTVGEIIKERCLAKIDFLKIDVEGFEFSVLKGTPWDTVQPDVVMCEFEDAKNAPLGHTWEDVADFLIQRGYHVYVSEWYPVIRYGIAHDWRRVLRYPDTEMSSPAWGNFLAFKEDPGLTKVEDAFSKLIKYKAKSKSKMLQPTNAAAPVTSAAPVAKKAISRPPTISSTSAKTNPFYKPSAIRGRTSAVNRFAKAGLLHIWTRKVWTIPAAILLSLLVALTFLDPLAKNATEWRFAIVAGLVIAALLYVTYRSFAALTELRQELGALQAQVLAQRDTAKLTGKVQSIQQKVETLASQKLPNFSKRINQTNRRLSSVDDRANVIASRVSATDEKLASMATQMNERVTASDAALSATDARIAAVTDQVTAATERIISTDERLAESDQRLTATEAALASVGGELERIESEDFAAKIQGVDTRVKSLEAADLAPTVENLDSRLQEFEQANLSAEISEIKTNQANTEAKLEESKGQIAELAELSERARHRLHRLDQWSQFDNSNWYQNFNRQLKPEHVEVLETEWPKRLSMPIAKSTLGYIASRACDIESQLDGRLATTVEDVVLRSLVASAIKGKSASILEIGTLFGVGSAIMFDTIRKNFADVKFTLLDPLDGYYNSGQVDILTGQPVDEPTLRANLARAGMDESHIHLVKRLSTEPEAISEVNNAEYDLLVIDGDHSYAGVKTDFENYIESVKLGGYIIFDDYSSPDWPEVQQYVDDEVSKLDYVALVGASWRTCVYRVVKPAKTTPAPRRSSARKTTAASKPKTTRASGARASSKPKSSTS